MRHLAPCLAAMLLMPALTLAQPPAPEGQGAQEVQAIPPATETQVDPATPPPTPMPTPPPDDGRYRTQVLDTEIPPAPDPAEDDPARFDEGVRFFLQVQSNSRVGDLSDEGLGMTFDFEAASLGGVQDALVGVRIGRLTAGFGITWSQVSSTIPGSDPCGISPTPVDLDITQTLFGVIPTVRFDAIRSQDGRGRFEVGANIPLLLSSRSQERFETCMPPFSMTPPITTDEASDGIYGFGLMLAGRYYVWPALSVGTELGFTYLVFDFDEDREMMLDPPSVTTLGFHAGLTLAIEVPL